MTPGEKRTLAFTMCASAGMQNETLRTIIGLLVGLVWTAAMVSVFLTDDVRPLEITTPIAALVFGRIMGYRVSVKKNQEDDK